MIASPRSHLEGLLLLEVRIWDAVEQGPCVSFGSGFGSGATWMLLRAVLVCVPGCTASVCVCVCGLRCQHWCRLNLQTAAAAATCVRVGWRDLQVPQVHPAGHLHPGKKNSEVWMVQ